jgi:drug/metabolite transporter (DMT)-like permease
MSDTLPRSRLAAAAPFVFIFLWSSAFVAVRAGLPDVSPLYFLSVRFTLAAAILLGIAALTRQAWRSLEGRWPHFVAAGVLINAAYLSLGYIAMTRISGATLALLGALHPVLWWRCCRFPSSATGSACGSGWDSVSGLPAWHWSSG